MVRILLVLVGVGVLINALTFLMVAHYFSSEEENKAAAEAKVQPPPPALESPQITDLQRRLTTLNSDLTRRFSSLETNLRNISKKVDQIAAQPPVISPEDSMTGTEPVEPGEEVLPGEEFPENPNATQIPGEPAVEPTEETGLTPVPETPEQPFDDGTTGAPEDESFENTRGVEGT